MIDDDLDAPEDFEPDAAAEKPSLREIWDSNPVLKLVAIVLVVVVLLGAYLIFSPKESTGSKTVIGMVGSQTKQIPGTKIVDPAYRKALEEENKKKEQEARQTGGSAMPVPIAISRGTGLQIPQIPQAPQSDVLAEWRRVANEEQMKAAQNKIQAESAPPPPTVPMVKAIRPVQVVKVNTKEAQLIAQQMRVILHAQQPFAAQVVNVTAAKSRYEQMLQKEKEDQSKQAAQGTGSSSGTGGAASGGGASGASGTGASGKVIIAAGSVNYAQLLTKIDSDVPGPVLAQVLSGPFSGARMIGSVQKEKDFVVIKFNTVVKDTVSYRIKAVAVDQNTTLAGMATSVNHHYVEKFVLPAAAAFLTGYSAALAQPPQQQTATAGGGVTATQSQSSTKQSMFQGLQVASQSVSGALNTMAQEPTTIIVAKGTTMGIFDTQTVTTKDAQ